MGDKQVPEETNKTVGHQQQWAGGLYLEGSWQWRIGKHYFQSFISVTCVFSQKNFKEITAADDIDKKTLAKMKKNAARDADII